MYNSHKCFLCGNETSSNEILVLHNAPSSAQDMPTKDTLEKDNGMDLHLVKCPCCGLVQLNVEPVPYYKDVIRVAGLSKTMIGLRKKQFSHLLEKYNLYNKKFLEIGSGNGDFLSILNDNFPSDCYAIENNAESVDICNKRGLKVIKDFANPTHIHPDGPFDCFLSFNFLEHQPNPNEMIQYAYNNLKNNGYGLITVPSFEYIMERGSYYELIRDHLCYYTFETITFLMNKNGFEVLEKERLNNDTLALIVRKKNLMEDLNRFQDVVETSITKFINSLKEKGEDVSVWGASHQGFTLCATTDICHFAKYIVDSAPSKQNKYAPASHLRIISPAEFYSHPTDNIVIVAPGYTAEISQLIRQNSPSVKIYAFRSNQIEEL